MRLNSISMSLLLGLCTTTACDNGDSNDAPVDGSVLVDMSTADQSVSVLPDGGAADMATSALTIEQFCEQAGQLRERAAIECCSSQSVQDWFRGDGAGSLANDIATTCTEMFIGNAFTQGKASFNSAAAATLLANYESNIDTCATTIDMTDSTTFRNLIAGNIAEGGNCRANFEEDDFSLYYACVAGTDCTAHYDEATETNTYTCDATLAVGVVCDSDVGVEQICSTGTYCPSRVSGDPDTTCTTLEANGAACNYGVDCMSQWCTGGDKSPGVCASRPADDLFCAAVG